MEQTTDLLIFLQWNKFWCIYSHYFQSPLDSGNLCCYFFHDYFAVGRPDFLYLLLCVNGQLDFDCRSVGLWTNPSIAVDGQSNETIDQQVNQEAGAGSADS